MASFLRQLDNDSLLENAKVLAREERRVTMDILQHIREINRRRLYATRGFRTLFEYVTRELGYSDAAGQRRIEAMRLLEELPEVEEKIKEGSLSLTHIAQAQRLFRAEAKLAQPFSLNQKREILKNLENRSTREADRELLSHSSQPATYQRPDQIKLVTPSHSEVRFVADQALLDQLDLVRGLLANKYPHLTLGELIAEMAKLSLEKLRPKGVKAPAQVSSSGQSSGSDKGSDVFAAPHSGAGEVVDQVRSRYIPASVKRAVYLRDEGRCQYVDSQTHRKCGSQFAIQYDHVVEFAKGGGSTIGNLQLVCAVHNRIRAIQSYSLEKMERYFTR